MASLDQQILQSITTMIIIGRSDDARKVLKTRYKLSAKQAERYYSQAEEDIRLAATCDRQTELAIAKKQLEQIISTAIGSGDIANAIKARDQLSKLLRLNELIAPVQLDFNTEESSISLEDSNLIRNYLESLGVAGADLPLTELARVVVDWVLENTPQEAFDDND